MSTDDGGDVGFVDNTHSVASMSWQTILRRSDQLASRFDRAGVGNGSVVVAAGSSTPETILLIFAAWRCGAAINLLPTPMAMGYGLRREIQERMRVLRPAAVCMPDSWWDAVDLTREVRVPPILRVNEGSLRRDLTSEFIGSSDAIKFNWPPSGSSLTDVAIYQATSGTTGQPRFVPVTWGMLLGNLTAIATRLDLDGSDRLASWLPLYHDMGLISFFALPAFLGARLVLVPTSVFARSPRLFLSVASSLRATMTGSPTTGIAMMAGAVAGIQETLGLRHLRRIVCGAEMIDLAACSAFVSGTRRHGLPEDALAFSYGLAEATLAVSVRPPSIVPNSQSCIDLGGNTSGDNAWRPSSGLGFAMTGRPVDGVEVRVANHPGSTPVGEIQVRGPSVFDGYIDEHSAKVDGPDADGWFGTGDLGYLDKGEVAIVGRAKDVLVVGGRTVAPDHVENCAIQLSGISRAVAFPMKTQHGEGFGVVAERSGNTDTTATDIRRALRQNLDLVPEVVHFVRRGELPRTTSGKLRRRAAASMVVDKGSGTFGSRAPEGIV